METKKKEQNTKAEAETFAATVKLSLIHICSSVCPIQLGKSLVVTAVQDILFQFRTRCHRSYTFLRLAVPCKICTKTARSF